MPLTPSACSSYHGGPRHGGTGMPSHTTVPSKLCTANPDHVRPRCNFLLVRSFCHLRKPRVMAELPSGAARSVNVAVIGRLNVPILKIVTISNAAGLQEPFTPSRSPSRTRGEADQEIGCGIRSAHCLEWAVFHPRNPVFEKGQLTTISYLRRSNCHGFSAP
jgi:hypothetical protein